MQTGLRLRNPEQEKRRKRQWGKKAKWVNTLFFNNGREKREYQKARRPNLLEGDVGALPSPIMKKKKGKES